MHNQASSDLPATAHSKAVTALEEFSTLILQYTALLDTQRALLAAGNIDGVTETVRRGDSITARAAACGRRIEPWRELIDSRQYVGPRVNDLSRRLGDALIRAAAVAASAAQVEAICLARSVEAGSSLQREGSSAAHAGGGRMAAYRPLFPRASLLDKHG